MISDSSPDLLIFLSTISSYIIGILSWHMYSEEVQTGPTFILTIVLFSIPLIICKISWKLRPENQEAWRFIWSHVGASVMVFVFLWSTLACVMFQSLYLLPPVLLSTWFFPIFAVNINYLQSKKTNIKFKRLSKFSLPQFLFLTIPFLLNTLLIYFFPMGTYHFNFKCAPESAENQEMCPDFRAQNVIRLHCMLVNCISILLNYNTWQALGAGELVLESVPEETGLIRKQRLIKKDKEWVVDDGPIRHIEMDRMEFI